MWVWVWVWVRSEGESENEGDTDPLPARHILSHPNPDTHTHTLTHPPQKYHHSTQDQILHPAQPTRQPARFQERISARITVKSFLRIVVFRLKNPTFSSTIPLKNIITRCRIKFCIQHSFTSEYQQEILESTANFSYVI